MRLTCLLCCCGRCTARLFGVDAIAAYELCTDGEIVCVCVMHVIIVLYKGLMKN